MCENFKPLDSTRPNIMSSSIANIWDDNIVDDKPWAPRPLSPVQLGNFGRNINVKPIGDYPNPSAAADPMVDLAKNIANLRTSVCYGKNILKDS